MNNNVNFEGSDELAALLREIDEVAVDDEGKDHVLTLADVYRMACRKGYREGLREGRASALTVGGEV